LLLLQFTLRIGFDHEHSRADRNDNVKIFLDNTVDIDNFGINSNIEVIDDTPYDFHSITHYNSDALQLNKEIPTILSRIPALLSDQNQLYIQREKLSPIDIYKVQKLYKCSLIKAPRIVKYEDDDDTEHEALEKVKERFNTEAKFSSINETLIERYLKKTYETCGINHFWPHDYPLVKTEHELYKLICVHKKSYGESCRFSLDCVDNDAICVRPFFIKAGVCFKLENEALNNFGQSVNDKMYQAGKKIKDTMKESFSKIKNIFSIKLSNFQF